MTLRLSAVFAVLVGINVYVFFYSPGSLQVVAQAAESASIRGRAVMPPPPPAPRKLERVKGVLRDGEGLGAALRREGLAVADADATLRALRPLLDFRRDLRAGQKYTLTRDEAGPLVTFELRAGATVYAVHRAPTGRLLGGKAPLAKSRRVIHH